MLLDTKESFVNLDDKKKKSLKLNCKTTEEFLLIFHK